MTEFSYEDINDDGSVPIPRPRDGIEMEIVSACGRRRFQTMSERNKVQRLVDQIDYSWSPGMGNIPPKFPIAWVRNCIEWARKENNIGKTSHNYSVIKIKLKSLISLIRNPERKSDWLKRQGVTGQEEDRGRYADPD